MRTLHVGLRVADLECSVGFYTALGYEVLGNVPETGFDHLTMLKLPGDESSQGGGSVEPGGLHRFVIQVESMHECVAGLGARGIQVEAPSSPDGSDDF